MMCHMYPSNRNWSQQNAPGGVVFDLSYSTLQDIVSQPKLFTGGASRFDVSQGILGDCWLVAAIASLTQDKILLSNVCMHVLGSSSIFFRALSQGGALQFTYYGGFGHGCNWLGHIFP